MLLYFLLQNYSQLRILNTSFFVRQIYKSYLYKAGSISTKPMFCTYPQYTRWKGYWIKCFRDTVCWHFRCTIGFANDTLQRAATLYFDFFYVAHNALNGQTRTLIVYTHPFLMVGVKMNLPSDNYTLFATFKSEMLLY